MDEKENVDNLTPLDILNALEESFQNTSSEIDFKKVISILKVHEEKRVITQSLNEPINTIDTKVNKIKI